MAAILVVGSCMTAILVVASCIAAILVVDSCMVAILVMVSPMAAIPGMGILNVSKSVAAKKKGNPVVWSVSFVSS